MRLEGRFDFGNSMPLQYELDQRPGQSKLFRYRCFCVLCSCYIYIYIERERDMCIYIYTLICKPIYIYICVCIYIYIYIHMLDSGHRSCVYMSYMQTNGGVHVCRVCTPHAARLYTHTIRRDRHR